MGMYIDQATSLNIFYDKPNADYLAKLTRMAWLNGNKTEYYLRRLASGEKITTEVGSSKTAVKEKPKTRSPPSPTPSKDEKGSSGADGPVCRRDNPDCLWCQ